MIKNLLVGIRQNFSKIVSLGEKEYLTVAVKKIH